MAKNRARMAIWVISAVVALAFGFALQGCSGGAVGHEGSWKAIDVESPAKVHMDPSLTGSSLTFELRSGGEGSLTLNGASVDIAWTETDSGVALDQGNGHKLDLSDDNGKLTMKDANGNTIYFEKK